MWASAAYGCYLLHFMYCTLCAVRCLNASSWASHLSGKKHKRNLSRSLPADSRSAGDVPNQSGPGVLVSTACPDQQATTFVTNQVARFLVHEIPKLWAGPNVATGVVPVTEIRHLAVQRKKKKLENVTSEIFRNFHHGGPI